MINVTKSFLPDISEYTELLVKIFDSGQITNNGSILSELEVKLKQYLNLNNLHFVSNGTIALQLAIEALELPSNAEIITTPFSYVATTSAILWQKYNPVFVDIEPKNFCIDASKIEEKITPQTKAILAVHVFGYSCDILKIEEIAKKYGLKVIYDVAHGFGCKYKKKSLLSYGDISTCSFHATKIFHTVEGGCCVINDSVLSEKIDLMKAFGHKGDEHFALGINAKNSEPHAAMGLCNIKYIDKIINERRGISNLYDNLLKNKIKRPAKQDDLEYNFSYYPILLENEIQLLNVVQALNKENIFPRRYFYPSLNTLPYLKDYQKCPVSEDIASRILCLPFYNGLSEQDVARVSNILLLNL